jgi:hypothetical protein
MHTARRLPAAISAVLVALMCHPLAHAADTFYVSAQLPYNVIEGDFDNVHAPEVRTGVGIGVSLGYKLTPSFGLEIRWAVTKHDIGGATTDFRELSVNGRYLFLEDKSIRPYVMVGYGDYSLGDSSLTFGGRGPRFGLGFDSFINSNVSWGVALARAVPSYDKITKSDGPVVLTGSLRGDTTSLILDIKYHF